MPDRLFVAWGADARPASLKSAKQWLLASLGVLLGAFTHAAWDAFTHENARGVRMLTVFDGVGLTIGANEFPWFRLLQHLSSVLGLLFVIGFVWRDVQRTTYVGPPLARRFSLQDRRRWFATYVVTAIVIWILAFVLMTQGRPHLATAASFAAVGSLWGLAGSLLLVSLLINWPNPTRGSRPSATDSPAHRAADNKVREGS
jgi:hypothetical protein